MGRRDELHQILVDLADGAKVYFQPPPKMALTYPCIIYQRDYAETKFADNRPHSVTKRYQVTIIDEDPDSEIPDRVALLPMSIFNRHFATDNLHHDIYSLYY